MGDSAAPAAGEESASSLVLPGACHEIQADILEIVSAMDEKTLLANAQNLAFGLAVQSQYDEDVEQNRNLAEASAFYAENYMTRASPVVIRTLQNCNALEHSGYVTLDRMLRNSKGKDRSAETIGNKRGDTKKQGTFMFAQLERQV